LAAGIRGRHNQPNRNLTLSRIVSARDRLERVNSTRPSGRIVIAGGSGFQGISLAKHLAGCGASIVVLSRSTPKVAGFGE
jgi:hypothetical protein